TVGNGPSQSSRFGSKGSFIFTLNCIPQPVGIVVTNATESSQFLLPGIHRIIHKRDYYMATGWPIRKDSLVSFGISNDHRRREMIQSQSLMTRLSGWKQDGLRRKLGRPD